MGYLDHWTMGTIVGTWLADGGKALRAGTYTVELLSRLTNKDDDNILPAGVWDKGPLNVETNKLGGRSLSVTVPTTDDPSIDPVDVPVRVTISFTGSSKGEVYDVLVPVKPDGTGETVNLRTKIPSSVVAAAVSGIRVGVLGKQLLAAGTQDDLESVLGEYGGGVAYDDSGIRGDVADLSETVSGQQARIDAAATQAGQAASAAGAAGQLAGSAAQAAEGAAAAANEAKQGLGTTVRTDDVRLTDARQPIQHKHQVADVSVTGIADGKVLQVVDGAAQWADLPASPLLDDAVTASDVAFPTT